jgi:hypothetical protein
MGMTGQRDDMWTNVLMDGMLVCVNTEQRVDMNA